MPNPAIAPFERVWSAWGELMALFLGGAEVDVLVVVGLLSPIIINTKKWKHILKIQD